MSTPLMLPRILAGNSLARNSGMGSGDSSGCSRPADTLCCLLIPITSSLFGFPGRLALAARPTDTGQPWPVRSRGERWGAGLPHPTALDGAAIQQYCLDCTVPAAERGGRWFGSPCRLGTPGEPSRASSGWSAPCQVGWRATRDGTCHQLYPKREAALTLGWTRRAPCQPGAPGDTDGHTVRTRAAPARGARCPSISHRNRRLHATCLPSSLLRPYPCQAGGCTRSPKSLRPRLTGQWGSPRPNAAPGLCWGPACSVGCPTAMPWCSMGGKEQQL